MAETAAEGMSLKQAFNKVNHARHWLMDLSMICMAISMCVATSGASVGLLDPVMPFLKMHVSGFTGLGDAVSFVPDAVGNAANGTWLSGATVADHAAHHAMEATTQAATDTAATAAVDHTAHTAATQSFTAAAAPPPVPEAAPPAGHAHHMHNHPAPGPPVDDPICGTGPLPPSPHKH